MKHFNYNAAEIEKKWQKKWDEDAIYKVADRVEGKENFYALSEFAYPSGNLHVGHWYAFAVPDIYARFKRMNGYNVLYPMGFDAFGLPAENAAIKRGLDPKKWTYENMEYMRGQLRNMGASFDWGRTLATCDPSYYKWTQWMFGEFHKNGLVERALTKTNWCQSCKTVLANEQVVSGACERCDNDVVQKDMAQWMLKITEFADDLVDDLEELPWDESIKQAQREWIGRKEGSEISFPVMYHSKINLESQVFGKPFKNSKRRDIVKVILENKNKDILLFTYKGTGHSDLPGGGLDKEESIIEAAKRELFEETNYINFSFKKEISSYSYTSEYRGEAKHGIVHGLVFSLDNEEFSEKQLEEGEEDSIHTWKPLSLAIEDFCINEGRGEAMLQILKDYQDSKIDVFTTRADTLFGATYVVLAPEHGLVQNLKPQIENWNEVEAYLDEVSKKSDLDRQQSKEKTGVELKGLTAINPATGAEIPVWIADYVLAHFGTGAVMAVPAHDERDAEFAIKYDLPFKFVVLPSAGEMGNSRPLVTSGENAFIAAAGVAEESGQKKINAEWNAMYDFLVEVHNKEGVLPKGKRFCCTFEGKLINSPGFNTKTSEEARKLITESVDGQITKTYRLRDWGISRQRYWGCPIPVVYDPQGKAYIVPKEHLPWTLPEDVDFTPDGTAPLARSEELKKRTIDIFGEGWTPEVDTMDTFVDSSWYFYRYLNNENEDEFASAEALKSWMPVDMYFGGAEHTTMHLLYSRFWVKALHKLGLAPANEPYKGRLNRGLILGPDGAKMSKSKGNVIDPDEVVAHVGADTVRMYLSFIGPFNEPGNYPWDPNGVVGTRRFIERVMGLSEKVSEKTDAELEKLLHKTIKKVSTDVDRLKLNTAISAMMVFTNRAEKATGISQSDYESLLKMFAVFAPHAAEEIWGTKLGNTESIHVSAWPEFDEAKCVDDEIKLAVQINGKARAEIILPADTTEEVAKNIALENTDVQKWIDGKEIRKFIYVPGRIVNIVV